MQKPFVSKKSKGADSHHKPANSTLAVRSELSSSGDSSGMRQSAARMGRDACCRAPGTELLVGG